MCKLFILQNNKITRGLDTGKKVVTDDGVLEFVSAFKFTYAYAKHITEIRLKCTRVKMA